MVDPTAGQGYHLTAATLVTVAQGPTIVSTPLGDESELYIAFPAGFTVPYFGTSYAGVVVSSNGYLSLGTTGQLEFLPSPATLMSGRPRVFGFWTDLTQVSNAGGPGGTFGGGAPVNNGTERYVLDVTPPYGAGYFRFEYNGVGDYAVPGAHHTFSIQIDTQGNIEIARAATCAASVRDTIVGISPGFNLDAHPKQDLLALATAASWFAQTDYENCWDWYGLVGGGMPNYNPVPYASHPYNLTGATLHFQPIGSGTLVNTTKRYHLY